MSKRLSERVDDDPCSECNPGTYQSFQSALTASMKFWSSAAESAIATTRD